MTRRSWTLASEPRGKDYQGLCWIAQRRGLYGQFVIRESLKLADRADLLLEAISHALVADRQSSSWPGTELMDATARIIQFRVDVTTARVLTSEVTGLYEWKHPQLPEDLSFIRSDGSVYCASISHERDAWLEVDEMELAELKAAMPDVALVRG